MKIETLWILFIIIFGAVFGIGFWLITGNISNCEALRQMTVLRIGFTVSVTMLGISLGCLMRILFI